MTCSRRLALALSHCVLLAAIGCVTSETHTTKKKPEPLPECPKQAPLLLQLPGDEHVVTAALDCGKLDPCEPNAPIMRGVAFTVKLQLADASSPSFEVLAADPAQVEVGTFVSSSDDRCVEAGTRLGTLRLMLPGESGVALVRGNDELDRLTFQVHDVASVQLAAAVKGALTLDADAKLELNAAAFDADGEQLITHDSGLYWLDDTESAALGEHDEVSRAGATATLFGKKPGDTQLHLLISNVEQVFPVHVR